MNYYDRNTFPPAGMYGPNREPPPPPPYWGPPPPWPPKPPKNPYKKTIRRNANIIGFNLLLFFISSIVLSTLIYGSLSLFLGPVQMEIHSNLLYFITTFISYIFSFGIVCIIMKFWIGIPAKVAFPMRAPRGTLVIQAVFLMLGVSVAGMFLSGSLAMLTEFLFGLSPVGLANMPKPQTVPEIIIYFISLAIAPAFLEELVFRGVIMQSLRRFGDLFALITSSILFSLAHGNLIQSPFALVLGIVIGFFVLRTGSLWTGIIMHLVNNGMSIVMELISDTLTTTQTEVILNCQLALYALLGILTVVFLLLRNPSLFRLASSNYPLSERTKYTAFLTAAMPIVFFIVTFIFTILDLQ